MASMRDINRRKESVQSTEQITKAMKLVSSVKLTKAKQNAEESKPYFDTMYETVAGMIAKSFSVGTKGRDALEHLGYEIVSDYSEAMNGPMYDDAIAVGKDVLSQFTMGNIGEIYLVYTIFKNTVVQIPTMVKLLPIDADDITSESEEAADPLERITLMNYEPAAEEALDAIVPKYINSLIFGGLTEAYASENGARMQAMDSATSNAEDMISDLSLRYNRARQASITQELTEIIAGASAIQ